MAGERTRERLSATPAAAAAAAAPTTTATVQHSSVPFRSLPFPSVSFRSIPFPSVPFRSLPFRSLQLPVVPSRSLSACPKPKTWRPTAPDLRQAQAVYQLKKKRQSCVFCCRAFVRAPAGSGGIRRAPASVARSATRAAGLLPPRRAGGGRPLYWVRQRQKTRYRRVSIYPTTSWQSPFRRRKACFRLQTVRTRTASVEKKTWPTFFFPSFPAKTIARARLFFYGEKRLAAAPVALRKTAFSGQSVAPAQQSNSATCPAVLSSH